MSDPSADLIPPSTPSSRSSEEERLFVPVPNTYLPTSERSPLAAVLGDDKAVGRLMDLMLVRGGLSIRECARRMGIAPQSLQPYLSGRRTRPGVSFFVKFVEACGGRVQVEWPQRLR